MLSLVAAGRLNCVVMGDLASHRPLEADSSAPPETGPTAAPAPETATAAGTDASVRALARANLFALLAVALILVLVSGLALWSSYRSSLREAESRADAAVAILAGQLDLALAGIDSVLQGLGERLAAGPPSVRTLSAYLAKRGAEMAMVRSITVLGPDGAVVADSVGADRRGIAPPFDQAPFFRAHLGAVESELFIGAPVRGVVAGKWMVPVSRAARGPDGGLKAVIVATVDAAGFEPLFRTLDTDNQLWAALSRTDGALLMPFPFNGKLLETPLAGYSWFVSRLHDSRDGVLRLATPDGVDRLVVHRAVGRWPLIMAVGMAADDVFRPFIDEAWLWALGLTATLVLVMVGARYHLRQTRRIALQASQLGRTTEDLTRVNHLLGQEVEERARAAAELYYRNLLLDAQLQMSPDGILVVDGEGHIRSWNHRFAEIWTLPEDAPENGDRDLAMELACEQLVDAQAFLSRVDHLFRNLDEEDNGDEMHFRDGRIVERFSRGLVDHEGRFSGRIWFFRDVTLSRRAAATARKLAAIVSSSSDAIIGKTIDGGIESWNAAAEQMFGYRSEEIIGQPLQALFPPERASDITERLLAARRGERIAHLETVGRHSSGERLHLSVTISPILDDEGLVTGLSTIARDITRRKRIEAALRERDQRNRVVLESLSEGVLLYDNGGMIVAANTAAQRILGPFFGSQGVIADEAAEVFDRVAIGADGVPVRREFQPAEIARTTGTPVLDVVIGLQRPLGVQGGTVWLLCNAQPIRAESGEVDGVVVSLLDITTRKKAEEELRESERHFRRTFDESPIGAAVVSLDGRFLRVNAELCRITGYAAEELVGHGIRDIALPEDQELDAAQAAQLIAGEISNYQVDKRCRRKNGEPIWLHFSVRMIRDAAGQPGTFLPMIEDITARKLAEERLARSEAEAHTAKTSADLANRAKSEFLATMSHELRSPLNAILGFAEILSMEMFGALGSPRYLGYAKDIHDSGRLLLSVIDDILDLSKIEAGKLELHEESVSVEQAVASALRLVQTRALAHGLGLDVELEPGLPPLWADGRLIIQMAVNLLSNAIKFTPRGGAVVVAAGLEEGGAGGLFLRVTDSGIGIAAEDLPKVLAPFEQVDNHLTRTQSGTGLGLPLVKSLVELHQGRFEIASEPGVGTTVTLIFPAERLRPV